MDLLVAESLQKQFGSKIALNQFSLNIPQGSVYGLLGPNGAGKTTFLRIVNQITAPDSGKVFLNGKELNKQQIPMVGYMPEERGLYKNMKVGEQAMYFAKLKGLSNAEAKKRAKYWFDKLEISDWWNKKLSELSKGMGQKVQFVITVLHEPELLIFDEPFSGFDPVNANIIANEILELREKGTTIIFSTHRMESVEEMCDHIALINLSNKVLDGKISDIKKQFKSGKYNIKIRTNKPEELHDFTDKQPKLVNDVYEFTTVIKPSESPNQLLQKLLYLGDIQLFEEDIPSLNEIFIKAVQPWTGSK